MSNNDWKSIRINSFQNIEFGPMDFTSNPTVELWMERKGRGYNNNGAIIKIFIPLNELIGVIESSSRILNNHRKNIARAVDNLKMATTEQ